MPNDQIMDMIVNMPTTTDIPFNCDEMFDFVIEHESEAHICQFKNCTSIVKWLQDDDPHSNESNSNENQTEIRTYDGVALKRILKPGTKITIPKPRSNTMTFKNIESLQLFINQNPNHGIYQNININYDDSEDVDVTSYDCLSPWNTGHNIKTIQSTDPKLNQYSNVLRVLTEKQPTATYTCNTITSIQSVKKPHKIKEHNINEYVCNTCNKKYKQKSSLNRHEKSHLPKCDDDNQTVQNGSTQQSLIPLNANELISI